MVYTGCGGGGSNEGKDGSTVISTECLNEFNQILHQTIHKKS